MFRSARRLPSRVARSTVALALTLVFASPAARGQDGRPEGAPPNVIVIYSDDQGTIDLNCYGADDLVTPHLDALAEGGIRFTQMYAPSAICSASRAGLLTGRYPVRAGVPGNVSSQPGQPGMSPDEITLAEMFRAAGYRTGHVGKWHLGFTPATMPNGQGFDESYGHMGGCIDNYSHFFYWNGPNRHDLYRNGQEIWEDGVYFGDLMVRESRRFIEAHRDQPFFLYWAINWPHYPMQGTQRWRDHYAHLEPPRRMYAEFVSSMDDLVGQVLETVRELGLEDDTIVVFQSDHGHSTEERAFFGGGNAGPYRGAKGCLFEGGIRVPAVVCWPGSLPSGQVRDQAVIGCDWLPTLAELCGIETPDTVLDGRSLVPLLRSGRAPSPHEVMHWHLGRGDRAQWAVRRGDWKLLGNPVDRSGRGELTDSDRLFLANLREDPTEMRNLAEDHPDVIRELNTLREQFLKELESD